MNIVKWNGEPISKPGIYANVPIDVYHGADVCIGTSVSSSVLRTLFTKSPAHCWKDSPYNPQREEREETAAFILGRAAHHLYLGEDDFNTSFVMRPELAPDGRAWNGNNSECKKWLAQQAAADRTVLTPLQIKSIRGMAATLAAHPLIQAGILNGGIELSIFWVDEKTGLWCKARPDAIPYDSLDLADLKTSAEFGDDLDRAIFLNFRYDMQGQFVRMGMREAANLEIESFSLVFVEKSAPYSVDVVSVETQDMDSAGDDIRVALDAFDYCFKTGNWFGPAGTQSDTRWARRSEWAEKHASWRRGLLEREIEQG